VRKTGNVQEQPQPFENYSGVEPSKENAMKKLLLAACVASFTLATAQAQTAEFYVVQDTSTKKCTIVEKKPTATTTVVVGDGVYKTRTEAESAMKTVKVCTN